MYCLQARPCSFQPGYFTGWGSEGVKGTVMVQTQKPASFVGFDVVKLVSRRVVSEGDYT